MGQCAHFSFKKCPICTHDAASAKFITNSHEMDYSVDQSWEYLIAHGHMNVKIETEAAEFQVKEYINGVFVAVRTNLIKVRRLAGSSTRGLKRLDPSFQPPMASIVFSSLLYVFSAANRP
jgi:hypothetical protein